MRLCDVVFVSLLNNPNYSGGEHYEPNVVPGEAPFYNIESTVLVVGYVDVFLNSAVPST